MGKVTCKSVSSIKNSFARNQKECILDSFGETLPLPGGSWKTYALNREGVYVNGCCEPGEDYLPTGWENKNLRSPEDILYPLEN